MGLPDVRSHPYDSGNRRDHVCCGIAGHWDRTGETINAPVLAVLLTDAGSCTAQLSSPSGQAGGCDAYVTAGSDAASESATFMPTPAAPTGRAVDDLDIGDLRLGSKTSAAAGPSVQAGPAPRVSPGVAAPFSMEQYALAMMRVVARPDHVGTAPPHPPLRNVPS